MTTAATHTPSRACRARGCPLPECVQAAYRYRKQIGLEHARGKHRLRDATQASTHVQRLNYAGWSNPQIAEASGVGTPTIQKLSNNQQKKISNGRAAGILAIEIGPPPADKRRVDATGTARRLRALNYIGHPYNTLAPRLGMTCDRLKTISTGSVQVVRPREAEAVARLYRDLSATPGNSKQVAATARKKGWHGPAAWNDIDNPAAKPETGRKRDGKPGARRKVHADPARVARLTAAGKSAQQIADELGCHKRTVVRARARVAELETAA